MKDVIAVLIRLLRTLTIPFGTTTGPRIFLGNDVPAVLQTFYGGNVTASVIWYSADDDYLYRAVFTPGADVREGRVVNNVVQEDTLWSMSSLALPVVHLDDHNFGGRVEIETASGGSGGLFIGDAGSSSATDTPFKVDNHSQPRGFKSGQAAQSDSAAVGAEAVVLTAPSADYVSGRAYKFTFGGWVSSSAANTVTFRIREGTIAGTAELSTLTYNGLTLAQNMAAEIVLRCVGDVTQAWVLTMQASAGTSTQHGSATRPRWFVIEDAGDNTDYADWPSFS